MAFQNHSIHRQHYGVGFELFHSISVIIQACRTTKRKDRCWWMECKPDILQSRGGDKKYSSSATLVQWTTLNISIYQKSHVSFLFTVCGWGIDVLHGPPCTDIGFLIVYRYPSPHMTIFSIFRLLHSLHSTRNIFHTFETACFLFVERKRWFTPPLELFMACLFTCNKHCSLACTNTMNMYICVFVCTFLNWL